MNILQIALLGNGIFSLLTGLFLLTSKTTVAQWFGLENSLVFLIIGLGLLYFVYTIFKELKHPNPRAVLFIIIQDFIWVIASIILLIIKPFDISLLGNQIIAGVALIVLLFGIGQSIGLAKVDSIKNKGLKRLSFERLINASKENTWKLISDVSNYHKVAPNIDSVKILSGQAEGMVRSCSHGKDSWTETCSLWVEEKQYSFQVDTKSKDYPYPLNSLQGTWKVEEISAGQSKVIMVFEFAYKHRVYNLLLHPLMKKKFSKICNELLDNWQTELEH